MSRAVAFSNNDVAQIVWELPAKLPGCLGFALFRKEGGAASPGAWQPLPAWVGFEGQSNPDHKPKSTEIWPVQKFEWKDLTARRGKTYVYKIVPVGGAIVPDRALTPIPGQTELIT